MGGVNLEKMKKKLKERQREKDSRGRSYFELQEGLNKIRILPPKGDSEEVNAEASIHYNISDKPFGCPKDIGKTCPVCDEVVTKLGRSKDPGDVALAKKFRAKKQFYYLVIDRTADEPKAMVFRCGPMIYDQLLNYFADDEWGDLSHPTNGYDIKIEKSGEGLETKYVVKPSKNSSEVEDVKKIMKNAPDLTEIVSYPDEDDIRAMLEGEAPEEDDDEESKEDEDEEDEKPTKAKGSKDDESDEDSDDEDSDDSDDEDDDDDDDEDEEDKGKGKKDSDEDEDEEDDEPKAKKSKGSKDDEDEDSDEDDDDDDDSDDDSDDESDDDEDEDDEPKKSKKSDSGKKESKGGAKPDVKHALARLRKMKIKK